MLNWRKISVVGNPLDSSKSYLVTDGTDISTTDIDVHQYHTGEIKFLDWTGDESTYENNQCCSGERVFDMEPTHWCPTDEIELPNK